MSPRFGKTGALKRKETDLRLSLSLDKENWGTTPKSMEPRALKGNRGRVASVDWVALRRAFIERPERPLVDELATEFGVSTPRLNRAMQDEGWAALRAARLDSALRSSDAAKALLDAARTEGTVQRAVSNLALEVITQLHDVTQAAARATGKAENTRANTLNTVTFALRNLTGALKEVGLVGLPRALKSAPGMSDEQGRWNPQMLAALNVTVQNIVGTAPAVASPAPAEADSRASDDADDPAPPPALAPASGATLDPVAAPVPEPVPADVL